MVESRSEELVPDQSGAGRRWFLECLHKLAANEETSHRPHNSMHHSFGSYFLGKTKDENLTVTEMGNSTELTIKYCRALLRDVDVDRLLMCRSKRMSNWTWLRYGRGISLPVFLSIPNGY